MIEAELPDGTILEFPNGTDQAVIQSAVKRQLGLTQDQPQNGGSPDLVSGQALGGALESMDSAQEDSILGDIDSAIKNVTGGRTLSELAAGANRSVAGFLDFVGPDNINAILQLAGSEKRVPTFSEAIAVPAGSFDDSLPGRAAGTAGEMIPAALGIGQALRGGAAALTSAPASESAKAGVLRQMGQSKPSQEISGALLAGAGQEVGREVGGETGAMVGSLAAPMLTAVPLSSAKDQANRLLKKSAPSIDNLKKTASGIYKSLDESGVSVSGNKFNSLVDDISATLRKEGMDQDLTPKATALVNRLTNERGLPKNVTELDTLRKVAKGAADSIDKAEARLGRIAIEKIDDFMDNIGGEVASVGNKEVGQAYRAARDLWQRARKAELLDEALVNAESQASGFENGIRTQFRQLLKKINTGKVKGFTPDEISAIKKTVDGTTAGNVARFLGKFGVLDGVTSRSLTTLGGAGVAGALGGVGAGAAVPLVGQVAGSASQAMTVRNARLAQDLVKAGKSASRIVQAYMRNTPKANRSPADLARLFIENKVPVESVNVKAAQPIFADAAILASFANFLEKQRPEEDKE